MYLLDSNVFMQAKNQHYGFDFCPAFWDWLDVANAAGRVASVVKVGDELKAGGDELVGWASARTAFFFEPDDGVITSARVLSGWAMGASQYTGAARNEFLASADYYLVAHAHAQGHVVVTHEIAAPNSQKRIKIPDACNALGVRCINPFAMLRAEQVSFVLGA
ncbi:MAG TPA: DUF4411 family protein [Baekduia sp.]|uniref:DUF4411 family protein n=1 Tax=Baekduia sp. TaxID=2600305 RepID=UPI002D7822AD|nr:DUF4411 family protein [Baekduia sp.]HET6505608.1 DUF4411 family protein [Baekduia sp.]